MREWLLLREVVSVLTLRSYLLASRKHLRVGEILGDGGTGLQGGGMGYLRGTRSQTGALQPIMVTYPSQPRVFGFEFIILPCSQKPSLSVLCLFLDSNEAQRSGRRYKLLASEAGMDGLCLIAGQPETAMTLQGPQEGGSASWW